MNNAIRCAILGTGVMGKRYAALLDGHQIAGMSLAAVCCRSEASRKWAKESLSSSVYVCGSEDELYAHSDTFDAVLVVTPHKLHPAMTIRALNEGKHVMCDKPTGITATDASAMQQAAVRAGRIYATMCHQRSYASHRKVKELIDAGAVGEIERASLIDTESLRTRYYHQSSSWRSSWTREGGGLLINQGHHLLDFWLWLFGLPEALYADIPYGKYNSFMVDDEASLVLDYPGRMTGIIILSTGEGGITQRLEIAGTRGRILLDGNTLTLTRFGQDIRAYAGSAQVTSRQELSMTTEEYVFGSDEHAYEIMLNNFGAAIRGEAPLIAPGRDGITTLELINAAYLSAWEGRRLQLPVDGQQYLLELQKHEKLEQAKCDGA